MLLKAGAELHTLPQWPRQTELLLAADSGNPECIKILLQARADVNAVDVEGNSILHALLKPFANDYRERITCLRLVFAAGANVNKWNMRRKTAVTDILIWEGLSLTQECRYAIIKVCFIAGQDIGSAKEQVRKNLAESELEICLRHLCRKAIRNHLLKLDLHQNLFIRVPRLGLPAALNKYVLYGMSLKDETDDLEQRSMNYE